MWKRPYLSGLLYRGLEIFLQRTPFSRQRLMNLQNFLKKRSLFVPMDGWIGLRSSTTLGAELWVKSLVFVLPISITGWKMFGRTFFAITMKRKFSTPMEQVCLQALSKSNFIVQSRKMCRCLKMSLKSKDNHSGMRQYEWFRKTKADCYRKTSKTKVLQKYEETPGGLQIK
ncbi:hypothetical protein AVEN_174950-1 [Araneus ventricosus]|uniref:Uncharacterized protein n=1 Tax=Araneus ventricosus TaxID=182803 RepID=A0A4Y2U5I3_ARAVE|nr:hypothetical protein AVEN_174950-1 [Araneus ventricosus]